MPRCTLLCLVMLSGCGGKPTEVQVDPPITPAQVAAPVVEPKFNSNDPKETFQWAFKRAKYFRDKESKALTAINQNALNDEEMKEFQTEVTAFRTELNSHLGEAGSWQATVKQISAKGVLVNCSESQKFDESLGRPFLGLQMETHFFAAGKPENSDPWAGSTLTLDSMISRAYAKILKPEDVIIVKGTLAGIEFGGLINDRFHDTRLSITVSNARVVEK